MENGPRENESYQEAYKKCEEIIYYGVHVPNLLETGEDVEKTNVFVDKMEALKLVKQFKKARFKAFNYYHEAVEFATHGGDLPNNSFLNLNKKEPEKENLEKCQFRGPKSQDLIKLRKAIEANDLNFVEKTIWDNPRYLISSGDTPSILQEGSRYNALHIAAKAKHAEMCELILNTIGNTEFVAKLYGEDEHQHSEDRVKILLDLYLNTPDKGVNETPLHFAVKFGAAKVVEVLTSFPQCDKNVKNKYGKLPNEIICERCPNEKVKEQISNLLEDNFYVPVLRYEGNCTPPVIGEPFTPKSPPNFDTDPYTPRVEIHAYAGPMEKKDADKFRKIWKTPPRSISKLALKDRLSNSIDSGLSSYNLKLRDPEKGLEAVGRELATKYNVSWKEYWPFLDNFIDLCSDEGLRQFEKYLSDRNEKSFSSDPVVNRSSSKSPSKSPTKSPSKSPSKSNNSSLMSSLCRRFDNMCILDDEESILDYVCPYVCLERSLKIFANRISNILRNLTKNCDLLMAEMKLFEQLIISYSSDKRFAKVDMQKSHRRLAELIVRCLVEKNDFDFDSKLKETNFELPTNKHLICVLNNIVHSYNNFERQSLNSDLNSDLNCEEIWEKTEKCSCVYQSKLKHSRRKTNGVKRNNSISKNLFKTDFNSNSDSSEDDEYYTPPTSPLLSDDDSEKIFSDDDYESYDDSRLPETDVFIDGSEPGKIDRDVFNALKYADDKLNPINYPYIYKWRHAVSLFKDDDRECWSSPKPNHSTIEMTNNMRTSTPCKGSINNNDYNLREDSFSSNHASPKSWFRVTGLYSPRASLNTYKNSLSFNL